MRQCTSTADVQMAPYLLAILAGQQRVTDEDLALTTDAARCELGLWHEDEHAGFVWDWEHKPDEALWARWTPDGGAMRFESLKYCEIEGGPDGDACTLYRDHTREHSWALRDPEMESFRRRVLAENAGWLAQFTRKRN